MPADTKITSSRPLSPVATAPGIEHAKVGRTQSDITHTRQHEVLKNRSGSPGMQSMRPRVESNRFNELKLSSPESSKTKEQEMSFLPPGGSRSDRHEFDDPGATSGGSFHEKEIVEEDKKPHGDGNHASSSGTTVKNGKNSKSEIEEEEPDTGRKAMGPGAAATTTKPRRPAPPRPRKAGGRAPWAWPRPQARISTSTSRSLRATMRRSSR
jgi:hypothetical protein